MGKRAHLKALRRVLKQRVRSGELHSAAAYDIERAAKGRSTKAEAASTPLPAHLKGIGLKGGEATKAWQEWRAELWARKQMG